MYSDKFHAAESSLDEKTAELRRSEERVAFLEHCEYTAEKAEKLYGDACRQAVAIRQYGDELLSFIALSVTPTPGAAFDQACHRLRAAIKDVGPDLLATERAARERAEAEFAVWRREADAVAHAGLRAQERADKAEADAAAMRERLEEVVAIKGFVHNVGPGQNHMAAFTFEARDIARRGLDCDAGRALLAERDALKAKVDQPKQEAIETEHDVYVAGEAEVSSRRALKAALGHAHAVLEEVRTLCLETKRTKQWHVVVKALEAYDADETGAKAAELHAALMATYEAADNYLSTNYHDEAALKRVVKSVTKLLEARNG